MATRTKQTQTTVIDTVAKKVLSLATKANDMAMNTTEKAVIKSFSLTEKGLGFSNKLVKKGLKVSARNHDVIFNTLETAKAKAVKYLPKSK